MPFESLMDLLAIDPPPKAEQPVSMTIKLIRNINLKNEDLIFNNLDSKNKNGVDNKIQAVRQFLLKVMLFGQVVGVNNKYFITM